MSDNYLKLAIIYEGPFPLPEYVPDCLPEDQLETWADLFAPKEHVRQRVTSFVFHFYSRSGLSTAAAIRGYCDTLDAVRSLEQGAETYRYKLSVHKGVPGLCVPEIGGEAPTNFLGDLS